MFQSFSRNFQGIVYVFVVVEPPWSSNGTTIGAVPLGCGHTLTLPLWGVMMIKEMMMMIDRNKGNLPLGGVSNKSSIRQVLPPTFM